MTDDLRDEIKQIIQETRSPLQRMSCMVCDHMKIYTKEHRIIANYCEFHDYKIHGDLMQEVCFNYRPLRKE